MIQHDVIAGFFAPVEILITEAKEAVGTVITYVRSSSLIVMAKSKPLTNAAANFDEEVDDLISSAVA